MKTDQEDEHRSNLHLIAGFVADDEAVDWQDAEKSAPLTQRAAIRKLRLISRISQANREKIGSEPLVFEGEKWGILKIQKKVGSGSFGEVFRARDPNLDRDVALKLYYPDLLGAADQTSGLLQEGRLLARLKHPNVATVFGAEQHEGHVGIWMEFIDGVTLAQVIQDQGILSAQEAMLIGRDLSRALAALHRVGIIHCDVKASNVMRAAGGRIVLMDLGVSRDMENLDPGRVYGTPLFVAPEVLFENRSTPQSDLYSVGVLLFLVVTGQYPVGGTNLAEVRENHQKRNIKLLRDLRPDLPAAFVRIVERALMADPTERFATAGELEQALNQALSETGDAPQVAEAGPPTGKPFTRFFKYAGLAILLAALAILGIKAIRPYLDRTPDDLADQHRVLITSLENRTGDESLDPIGLMAADWITGGILRAGFVSVVPTMTTLQSTRALPDGQISNHLQELTDLSGATIILTGAYYQVDDSLRYHMSATDTRQGRMLSYLTPVTVPLDRPMAGIEQLKQKVMGALAVYLNSGPYVAGRQPGVLTEPPSYEAYREYVAGLKNFGLDYPKSLHHFEKATAIDPDFLPPHLWKIAIYYNAGHMALADSLTRFLDSRRDNMSSFERLWVDYWRTLLDGNLVEEYRTLKSLENYVPKDHTVNFLVMAIESNMNNPRGAIEAFARVQPPDSFYRDNYLGSWRFNVLANAYHILGNYDQALETVRLSREYYSEYMWVRIDEVRAMAAMGRFDDLDAVVEECLTVPYMDSSHGRIMVAAASELRFHGHLVEAREMAGRAVTWHLQQGDQQAEKRWLGEAYRLAEQWDAAQLIFEEMLPESPTDLFHILHLGYLGSLAARMGDEARARRIALELEQTEWKFVRGFDTFRRACITAQLGEHEEAIILLREAIGQGSNRWQIRSEMDMEPLRRYPAYQDLITPRRP